MGYHERAVDGQGGSGQSGSGLGYVQAAVAAGAAGGPVGIAVSLAITATIQALTFMLNRNKARNAEKTLATAIVNEAEPYFAQNRDSFLAAPRNANEKLAYLAAFDEMWGKLATRLADPRLEGYDIGQKSLQERSRTGRPHWGKNWWELYRDPIEQAGTVETAAQVAGALGVDESKLWVYGLVGMLGIGAWLMYE